MEAGTPRDHPCEAWLALQDADQEVADRGAKGQLAQERDGPVASMEEVPVPCAVPIENGCPVADSSLKVLVDHVASEKAAAEGEEHSTSGEGIDEGSRVADGEDSRR